LAELCLFQFNCWLLWGPSVALCECPQWSRRAKALQFGFGDENNSLDLFVTGRAQREILRRREHLSASEVGRVAFIQQVLPPGSYPVARRRSVTATIRVCHDFADAICACQRSTLEDPKNERLILQANIEDISGHDDEGRTDPDPAYYSAYLWVMFVVCNRAAAALGGDLPEPPATGRLQPLHERESERWMDLLPFFYHGNIASPQTCDLQKQILARQVVEGLALTLRQFDDVCVRYVCAIDDSGCGSQILYPPVPGRALADFIRERLDMLGKDDPNLARRIEIPDQPDPAFGSYASCHLPELVASYYEAVAREDEQHSDISE
jgi:hypothetical protein